MRPVPDVDELAGGVRAQDRAIIARAITLVESTRADHQLLAQKLIEAVPVTEESRGAR